MGDLVKAASDLFAAVLSALGFVGRTRHRAAIRHDLELLKALEDFDDLGPTSSVDGEPNTAHRLLVGHITVEVARYTGALNRKKRPWSSIVLAFLIGVPLGYWTYSLDKNGFEWISLLPGVIAFLMFVSMLGMLMTPKDDDEPPDPAEAELETTR